MRCELSPLAEADLQEIGDYIAQDNPQRAESFIDELMTHIQKIAHMPTGYPAREDLAPGVRMCTHGRYLLFFRILADVVRVERILHGRRDVDAVDFMP